MPVRGIFNIDVVKAPFLHQRRSTPSETPSRFQSGAHILLHSYYAIDTDFDASSICHRRNSNRTGGTATRPFKGANTHPVQRTRTTFTAKPTRRQETLVSSDKKGLFGFVDLHGSDRLLLLGFAKMVDWASQWSVAENWYPRCGEGRKYRDSVHGLWE